MTERIFSARLISRLALAITDVQQASVEAADLEASDAQDAAIYRAYQESGGDAAGAKRQLAAAQEACEQIFGRVVEFIADRYGLGPLEQMSDSTLRNLTEDGLEACTNWTDYIDEHKGSTVCASPLRLLLGAYHAAEKRQRDMHEEIFWPVVKRVSRLG